jgi:SAM-dependent methyltransferase
MMSRLAANLTQGLGAQNLAARQAWVAKTLAAVPQGARILDAGAGEQQYRQYCAHLEYVSQDFNQYDGAGDSAGLQTGRWDTSKIDIVSDILTIPAASGSFDAVLCTEVLEHVPNPVAALTEFQRLLRPGGMLILTAPFASLTHFAPYHYCTGFSRYWYTHQLDALGFDIISLTANGDYADVVAQELRRVVALSGPRSFLLKAGMLLFFRQLIAARRGGQFPADLACHGFHVVAVRRDSPAGGAGHGDA